MSAGTKLARDIVARAMTKEEAESLDKEHQREHYTNSRRGLRVDTAHKECISHIVQTRDEHTDDRRHSH